MGAAGRAACARGLRLDDQPCPVRRPPRGGRGVASGGTAMTAEQEVIAVAGRRKADPRRFRAVPDRAGGRAPGDERARRSAHGRAARRRRARALLEDDAVDDFDLGAIRNLRARLHSRADFFLPALARAEDAGRHRDEAMLWRFAWSRRSRRGLAARRAGQRRKRFAIRDDRDDSIRGMDGARHAHRDGTGHSARLPVLRGAIRGISDPDAHRPDRRFHRRRAAREQRSGLSRRELSSRFPPATGPSSKPAADCAT